MPTCLDPDRHEYSMPRSGMTQRVSDVPEGAPHDASDESQSESGPDRGR